MCSKVFYMAMALMSAFVLGLYSAATWAPTHEPIPLWRFLVTGTFLVWSVTTLALKSSPPSYAHHHHQRATR